MAMRDQKYYEYCITYAVLLGGVVKNRFNEWSYQGLHSWYRTQGYAAEAFLRQKKYIVCRSGSRKGELITVQESSNYCGPYTLPSR